MGTPSDTKLSHCHLPLIRLSALSASHLFLFFSNAIFFCFGYQLSNTSLHPSSKNIIHPCHFSIPSHLHFYPLFSSTIMALSNSLHSRGVPLGRSIVSCLPNHDFYFGLNRGKIKLQQCQTTCTDSMLSSSLKSNHYYTPGSHSRSKTAVNPPPSRMLQIYLKTLVQLAIYLYETRPHQCLTKVFGFQGGKSAYAFVEK